MSQRKLHIVQPEEQPQRKRTVKRKPGEPIPGRRTIYVARIVNRADMRPEPGSQAEIDALPANYEPMCSNQKAVRNARHLVGRTGWTRFILKVIGR